MKSKIYIITRFNAPCFPTRKDLAERRLDDTWLRERVRLFKQYCYPSVVNQSFEEFRWIVWCHPDTPLWLERELTALRVTAYFADSYYKYIDTDVDTLVTIRLDNDDMIHQDFVKNIHAHIEEFQASGLPRQVYSFTKGYRYYDARTPMSKRDSHFVNAGSLVECKQHNSPFLALYANLKVQPATDTDHLVYCNNHGDMPDLFPTVYNDDLRAWIWVHHDNNTGAIAAQAGSKVDNKILKEFGV